MKLYKYYKKCECCKGTGEIKITGEELLKLMKLNNEIKKKHKERRMEITKEKERVRQEYLNKFLPCPFCGSKNLIVELNGKNCNWVRCSDCDCTGPIGEENEADVILKWNKRAKFSS